MAVTVRGSPRPSASRSCRSGTGSPSARPRLDGNGEHGCRDDHVAAVVECSCYCGFAERVASGERIGAAASLHVGDGDWAAGAKCRSLAGDKTEVAHAIKVGIVRNTRIAITETELSADIEVDDLGAAAGGSCIEMPCPCPTHPAQTARLPRSRSDWALDNSASFLCALASHPSMAITHQGRRPRRQKRRGFVLSSCCRRSRGQ